MINRAGGKVLRSDAGLFGIQGLEDESMAVDEFPKWEKVRVFE